MLPLIAPVTAIHALSVAPWPTAPALPLIYLARGLLAGDRLLLYYVIFQDEYASSGSTAILFVFFYLGDHAVADLLGDRHLPHGILGHPSGDRRDGRGGDLLSAIEAIPAVPLPKRGRIASLGRAMAMLLLPASILPVIFFGGTLLRSPEKLTRQTGAAVERLLAPAPHARREWLVTPVPAEPSGFSPEVRLGWHKIKRTPR